MKRNILLTLAAVSYIFIIFICGWPKELESQSRTKKIETPLSGKEYWSNKEFFRAKSSGKSPDIATAKKIALNNAKSKIAGLIKSTLKSLSENYTKQRSVANAKDFKNKF